MKTIKCNEPQPSVTIRQFDGKDYIYICVNPRMEETENDEVIYIYDHNEIIEKTGILDLDDVTAQPRAYLDYEPGEITRLDKLEALVMALLEDKNV